MAIIDLCARSFAVDGSFHAFCVAELCAVVHGNRFEDLGECSAESSFYGVDSTDNRQGTFIGDFDNDLIVGFSLGGDKENGGFCLLADNGIKLPMTEFFSGFDMFGAVFDRSAPRCALGVSMTLTLSLGLADKVGTLDAEKNPCIDIVIQSSAADFRFTWDFLVFNRGKSGGRGQLSIFYEAFYRFTIFVVVPDFKGWSFGGCVEVGFLLRFVGTILLCIGVIGIQVHIVALAKLIVYGIYGFADFVSNLLDGATSIIKGFYFVAVCFCDSFVVCWHIVFIPSCVLPLCSKGRRLWHFVILCGFRTSGSTFVWTVLFVCDDRSAWGSVMCYCCAWRVHFMARREADSKEMPSRYS